MKLPDFVRTNVLLARYSTLGVGGPADYFANITSEGLDGSESADSYVKKVGDMFFIKICEACEFARDNGLDIFVLGRGSNVMFADSGFRGLVIRIDMRQKHFVDDEFWVEAGSPVSDAVTMGEQMGFSGFEWAAGLPGTVGGAIYGNAGCYGGQFRDVVKKIMFFDGEYFQTWKARPDMFGYRRSVFKNNPNWIIVAASLRFEPRDSDLVMAGTKRTRTLRQNGQPKEKSAGCIFKNPIIDGGRVSAGQLIDFAGLKNLQIGRAMISREHGNFFVNLGGAKASDFLELIKIAKGRVFEKSGVLLEEEIIRVGEF